MIAVEKMLRHLGARRRHVGVIPPVHRVLVVHRDANLEHVLAPLAAAAADREDVREHDRVAVLPVGALLALAFEEAALDDAPRELVERDLLVTPRDGDLDGVPRFLTQELVELAVQPLGVHRVDRILHRLNPVAVEDGAPAVADRALLDEAVIERDQRGRERPEVRPEQAAEFLHRVARRRDLVLEVGAFGFVGLLEAAAGAVELPAVIGAADAVFGRDAVRHRCAAVRAELADQAERAAAVLEEDEVLAEDAHALRPAVFHLGDAGNRVPVAA